MRLQREEDGHPEEMMVGREEGSGQPRQPSSVARESVVLPSSPLSSPRFHSFLLILSQSCLPVLFSHPHYPSSFILPFLSLI